MPKFFAPFFFLLPLGALVSFLSAAPDAGLTRVETLLDAGHPQQAESLFQDASAQASAGALRHRREILQARLAAAQGNWRKTDAVLRAWKNSPDRSEGSGEIFFWLGWSAVHQGRKSEADSLFVLASAYAGEGSDLRRGAQEALEYRFAGLLEQPPALLDYLRGLPESPLPDSMRVASLERLPENSRLFPYGQWQLGLLLELMGDTARSRQILVNLSANFSSLPARKAAAHLSYELEKNAPDSAKKGYESLLLKQQQGVSSEFSRKRLQSLRNNP